MDQQGIVVSDYDPKKCADDGARMFIRDLNGKATKAYIDLMGADSDAYTEKSRDLQRKRSREMERARKLKFASPEEIEEDAIELLVVVTKGWGEIQLVKGQPAACTPANVRELYLKRPDIREQADAFINERINFLPKPASA